MESGYFLGTESQSEKVQSVLEMEGGDGCTTM